MPAVITTDPSRKLDIVTHNLLVLTIGAVKWRNTTFFSPRSASQRIVSFPVGLISGAGAGKLIVITHECTSAIKTICPICVQSRRKMLDYPFHSQATQLIGITIKRFNIRCPYLHFSKTAIPRPRLSTSHVGCFVLPHIANAMMMVLIVRHSQVDREIFHSIIIIIVIVVSNSRQQFVNCGKSFENGVILMHLKDPRFEWVVFTMCAHFHSWGISIARSAWMISKKGH